jgi:outer membrane receptor protein involved in Fe transport
MQANCDPSIPGSNGNPSLYNDEGWGNLPEVTEQVEEIAAEVAVPLVTDQPFMKHMDLDLAARHTDYSDSGQYDTWKAGLVMQVNSSVTLRGTVSRDIRAPSLYNLYQPPSITTPPNPLTDWADPSGNTSYTVKQLGGGNPHLKAELGFTQTGGFVVTPSFLPGFSAAVDYFHVEVDRAIYGLSVTDQSGQQACYASGGTSAICPLIVRADGSCCNAASKIVSIYGNANINLAKVETRGVDIELNYRTRVINRPLALRGFLTYQPHVLTTAPANFQQPPIDSSGTTANGSNAAASTRILASADFDVTDKFATSLSATWRSRIKPDDDTTDIFAQSAYVGSVGYADLDLTYKLNPGGTNMDVNLHISNLLNRAPPVSGVNQQAFLGIDDAIGRYYTLAVRGRF